MADSSFLIRVGHSPDPDDAFMFYALAKDKIPTGRYRFVHELVDIETLNQRAFAGELELTALSIHAYAYLSDRYILCNCGASMGDYYGPMVVARDGDQPQDLARSTIAVPGRLTSAFLALRLYLNREFDHVIVPFDHIPQAVAEGRYGDRPVDAGLLIHEGQLTYSRHGLKLIIDLGQWWTEETGLPLPLGANAVRKDLGREVAGDVDRLLLESIRYGLEHREEALAYAQHYGRDLDAALADRFVGMYVNDWTLDFGPRGRAAIAEFLRRGFECGALPRPLAPEFIT